MLEPMPMQWTERELPMVLLVFWLLWEGFA